MNTPETSHSSPPPERILIIRPSALGDVCRSVPVLASLRRAFPEATIDWVVQRGFEPAVAAHPSLDSVVPFPRRELTRWWTPPGAIRGLRWLRTLREPRYDWAIDCQGLARSGLMAWWTRAPVRIGYANADELSWLGVNRRFEIDRRLHAVERMLRLIESAGVESVRDMTLFVPDGADSELPESLRSDERFAVVAPTSRWPGKRWPAAWFAEVAHRLVAEDAVARVAIVGAASERAQCADVLALAEGSDRFIDLVGRTSVGGLMAAVARASLVIANDSAAVHMAVGFNRPLVALYGPTDVSKVGPYGRERDVLQHVEQGERLDHKDEALGRRYMGRISVREVLEAAVARVGTAPRV